MKQMVSSMQSFAMTRYFLVLVIISSYCVVFGGIPGAVVCLYQHVSSLKLEVGGLYVIVRLGQYGNIIPSTRVGAFDKVNSSDLLNH